MQRSDGTSMSSRYKSSSAQRRTVAAVCLCLAQTVAEDRHGGRRGAECPRLHGATASTFGRELIRDGAVRVGIGGQTAISCPIGRPSGRPMVLDLLDGRLTSVRSASRQRPVDCLSQQPSHHHHRHRTSCTRWRRSTPPARFLNNSLPTFK